MGIYTASMPLHCAGVKRRLHKAEHPKTACRASAVDRRWHIQPQRFWGSAGCLQKPPHAVGSLSCHLGHGFHLDPQAFQPPPPEFDSLPIPCIHLGSDELATRSAQPWMGQPLHPLDFPLNVTSLCDEQVVTGLAATLESLSLFGTQPVVNTSFHCGWRPPISIRNYVSWFWAFLECSVECFVLGLIYIDRLVKRSPDHAVNPNSCHRLLACSMTIAAKYHDDGHRKNNHYATVADLDLRDLNDLQRSMLKLLDYKLVVELGEFELYRQFLNKVAFWTTI